MRQSSRHSLPASSFAALTRIASSFGINSTTRTLHSPHVINAFAVHNKPSYHRPYTTSPQLNIRWLSTHPICDPIDYDIAKDLSAEEFDSECDGSLFLYHRLRANYFCLRLTCFILYHVSADAYKYVYHQHNHPRGPWLRTLHSAQNVLKGIHRYVNAFAIDILFIHALW